MQPLDPLLVRAQTIVLEALQNPASRPQIQAFFDADSSTVSYLMSDSDGSQGAIIDSVLDFDSAAGRTAHTGAEAIAAQVHSMGLQIDWHLETHVHADHLSAAPWLRATVGGKTGIGEAILQVQSRFGEVFLQEPLANGEAFDHLFCDGERFSVGKVSCCALHVPGHTPADVAYVMGDAVFVGDTLFMPDYGTARADFPGGDARALYRSIRRLLSLPPQTRIFVCHDYKAPGRDFHAWETTVLEQRQHNLHVNDKVGEQAFVAMRTTRDATLAMPRLMLPAIQVNIRGGLLPEPEANGRRYLRIPLNTF